MITEALQQSIEHSYASILAASPTLNAQLAATLDQLEANARQTLEEESPYGPFYQQLQQAEAQLDRNDNTVAALQQDWQAYRDCLASLKLPTNQGFWQGQMRRAVQQPDSVHLIRRLLLRDWRKQLERSEAKWELDRLALLRTEMLAQLKAWLDTLIELSRNFERLGLEPGFLVDFSAGQLSQDDVETLKRWCDYLADNPGVLDLCHRIGKQRKPSYSTHYETVSVRRLREVNCPNAPAKEELVGLRLDQQLSHTLPSELALLGDEDTALLFDLKYLERQLQTFEMRGWQPERTWVNVDELKPVSTEDNLGPMVICVDSSLSMQGQPEKVAKALALFLAATGRSGQRKCFLINFSTDIETLNLSDDGALPKLLGFLTRSFHGGTDVAPAIDVALEVLGQDDYRNADMVVVSDFVLADLPAVTLNAMGEQRRCGNRFYSVVIGEQLNQSHFQTLFDCQWQYLADQGDIIERLRDSHADAEMDHDIAMALTAIQGSA
ncbi:hypothetical protein SAMN04488540_106118 [Ferrimonas sediminum]|uniref:VWFA domain-containing protein n=1 Tax=Ferrimonas sediminum TaxID=718193 RepID=A0A1G8SAA2_9GAMM|nr:VWA domain-containing protein [Ferrimonas sediminum]SDJ26156.1 hypothetical protein SAMN04488540_106118 [Ferrimonas sediminum]